MRQGAGSQGRGRECRTTVGISWVGVRAKGANEHYDLMNLIVVVDTAKSGHAAGLPVLDAIEQVFVGIRVPHQLRALACLAAIILVAKTTNVAEGAFDVEGFCSRCGRCRWNRWVV